MTGIINNRNTHLRLVDMLVPTPTLKKLKEIIRCAYDMEGAVHGFPASHAWEKLGKKTVVHFTVSEDYVVMQYATMDFYKKQRSRGREVGVVVYYEQAIPILNNYAKPISK